MSSAPVVPARVAGRRPAGLRALLLLMLLSACGPQRAVPERVVVIVLDTTHAAHLGCYGGPEGLSPAVDGLAARGRRFARAVSNSTWTLPSSVSLLTGQLQERHGVVTNKHVAGDDLPLLPEAFAAAGYDTAAFVEMIYASGVHGLDRGFAENHYYSLTGGTHPLAMQTEVVDWVEEHAGERYFLYVHYRRPHSPYEGNTLAQRRLAPDCALADGRQDADLSRADRLGEGADLDVDQAAHVEHLYRANLANADRGVRALLKRLERDPGALVVLTSDHGESLGDQGYWGHGYRLHPACVDIPLIVAGPGVVPGVDAGPACTVDVAPTLRELCGLPPGPDQDGRSLARRLAGGEPGGPRPLLLSTRYNPGNVPLQGVVDGPFKLVLDGDGTARLFDRRDDPEELVDVAEAHPEVLARLLPLAEARRRAGASLAERDRVELDAHEAELRALGYLGDDDG